MPTYLYTCTHPHTPICMPTHLYTCTPLSPSTYTRHIVPTPDSARQSLQLHIIIHAHTRQRTPQFAGTYPYTCTHPTAEALVCSYISDMSLPMRIYLYNALRKQGRCECASTHMCLYICTHIQVCGYTCMSICMHTYRSVRVHMIACAYVLISSYLLISLYLHTTGSGGGSAPPHAYIHIYIYLFVYIYIYIYIYVYIYIYM